MLPRPAHLPAQLLTDRGRFRIHGQRADSLAYSLACAAQQARAQGRLLVVFTEKPEQAAHWLEALNWFAPELRAQLLPDWETLPYDSFSPHRDLIAARLSALYQLLNQSLDVLLLPVISALNRCAPPEYLAARTFSFKQGDTISIEQLKSQLVRANYAAVSQVVAAGEFAIRGGVIDIYPVDFAHPLRLDFFGETLEALRAFDPDTQRSIYPMQEVQLLPAHEFALTDEARNLFRTQWRARFEGDLSRHQMYRDIGQGTVSPGIEYYLPLFFEHTATLFDYLPLNSHLVLCGDVEGALQEFTTETQTRYEFVRADSSRPVLAPTELFLNQQEFFTAVKNYAAWDIRPESPPALPNLSFNRRDEKPLSGLQSFIQHSTTPVVLCADSVGRRETLVQLLAQHQFPVSVVADFTALQQFLATATPGTPTALLHSPLLARCALPQCELITESELFSHHGRSRISRQQEKGQELDSLLRDISEIHVDELLVHRQHGVGRYKGLIYLNLGQGEMEFLHLEYANSTNLYVPVTELHQVSRYAGVDSEHVNLHALGSGKWDKAKQKARERIRDTAAELLHLYAQRAMKKGYAFELSTSDYADFCEEFAFTETPDQARAIEAVMKDMLSDSPMDRLICGDVGFGKTEVALRATFIAAMNGKQVLVLTPTTLLAEQHFQQFSQRFRNWPLRCAELSRFRSAKEAKIVLQELADGKVDIVVGTHKLLSNDVQCARLGLVIVDEEHRFGIRQKEQLKALSHGVDVLTLTATPIPRTLSLALDGLRDFSVIATAPEKRLAIKTFVRQEESSVIREACLRELKRGGQVFYLHNEVSTIENRRIELQKLLPEARIAIAHGQMAELQLERVMRDFVMQRVNVLLCSTIIETGIDVPNANTIVIHRADKFGLAQLHQLRGRVGRSHHQAYAYLLTPGQEALTKQAEKRLNAIVQMDELGSGFYLAMHDLEIRGAGEILGEKQSGEVQEIGFEMYTDLLKRAIADLKAGRTPDLSHEPRAIEINLHTPLLLPENYCPDIGQRLNLYKRLASAEDEAALRQLHEEIIDRFGLLPEPAQALLLSHYLRVRAKTEGIEKIDASSQLVQLKFGGVNRVEPQRLIELIQRDKHIKLQGNEKIRIERKTETLEQRRQLIEQVLQQICRPAVLEPND